MLWLRCPTPLLPVTAVHAQGSLLPSLGLSFPLPKARIIGWLPGEGRVSGEEVPGTRALLSPVQVPLMWAMPVCPGKIGVTSQAERGPGAQQGRCTGSSEVVPAVGGHRPAGPRPGPLPPLLSSVPPVPEETVKKPRERGQRCTPAALRQSTQRCPEEPRAHLAPSIVVTISWVVQPTLHIRRTVL